jgi:hypothetical protein
VIPPLLWCEQEQEVVTRHVPPSQHHSVLHMHVLIVMHLLPALNVNHHHHRVLAVRHRHQLAHPHHHHHPPHPR